MKPPQNSILVLLACLPAALCSCRENANLRAKIQEAQTRHEGLVKTIEALDQQANAIPQPSLEAAAAEPFRLRLEAAEKQMKEIGSQVSDLDAKIKTAENAAASVEGKLADFKKHKPNS